MFGGRRENVENASADGEFAALADHVHAGVRELDESSDGVFELRLGTDGQGDGLDLGQVGRHRLQQRSGRRHHHAQRRSEALVVGTGQPAQHQHAGRDSVDTG
jgi:hypothetical protein